MDYKKVVAIVGSRTFSSFENFQEMNDFIEKIIDPKDIFKIVLGGAKGADTLAKAFAEAHNIKIKEFFPDWKNYGKMAGFLRNIRIIEAADIVFAFWDGKSRGTKNSIKIAKELNKDLYIFNF